MTGFQITFRQSHNGDLPELVKHVHWTIKKCYPDIYEPAIVNFFLNYHNKSNLQSRLANGIFILGLYGTDVVACGYLLDNEIGGVYINPGYQRQGIGTKLVMELIKIANKKMLKLLWLDATPMALDFYLSIGFELIEKKTDIIKGKKLDYYRMHLHLK